MIINTGIEYYRGLNGEYRSNHWNRFNLFVPASSKGQSFMRVVEKHNIVASYLERHPITAKTFNLDRNGIKQYFAVLEKALNEE